MTWEEANEKCPEGIVPACHNAAQRVTVSGAANKIASFATTVREEGGVVIEVDSNGIPFHSPHLKKAGKAYHSALKKVWIILEVLFFLHLIIEASSRKIRLPNLD